MQSRVYSVDEVQIEALMVIPEAPPAIVISARGWVTTSGWTHPDLTPWVYIAPPADGILDLDFVATPPTGFVLQVMSKIQVAKTMTVPGWLKGVRIHTSTNKKEALLDGSIDPSKGSPQGEGMPLPWPFPWWTPRTVAAR